MTKNVARLRSEIERLTLFYESSQGALRETLEEVAEMRLAGDIYKEIGAERIRLQEIIARREQDNEVAYRQGYIDGISAVDKDGRTNKTPDEAWEHFKSITRERLS